VTARDVDLLQHRLDSLTRGATRIRQHLADLHCLAYEAAAHTGDDVKVRTTNTDHTPKAGDPRARHVWERLAVEVARCEDILVGLERQVLGYFMVTSSVEPSRGSLIPAGEHARLLAAQRARAAAGEYTPARLVDQPPHPGKKR
jgi:hypothetical protein